MVLITIALRRFGVSVVLSKYRDQAFSRSAC